MSNLRLRVRSQYQREIDRITTNLDVESQRILDRDRSLRSIVEDALRVGFRRKTISKSNLEQCVAVARGLIEQLKDKLSQTVFYKLLTEYLLQEAYDNQASPEVNQLLKEIYRKNLSSLTRGEMVGEDVVGILLKSLKGSSKQEIEEIVYNQLHIAAVYASIQMIKNSGIAEHMEMYFDVCPDSCKTCQNWALRNPYTVKQAEELMLPHRGCTCMWVACLKY